MVLITVSGIALITAILSWFAIGQLISYLNKNQIVDRPNERTLHQGSVPRGGGLVIVGATLIAIIGGAFMSSSASYYFGLALFVFVWAALGWYDDRLDASASSRLLSQFMFALCAVIAYGYIDTVALSDSVVIELGLFGTITTILSIVWLANLYNFMDGLDGLAASQTIVAAITMAFWFHQVGDMPIAIICVVLAAASYAFLLWNWAPAKIFMGDVGSLAIGAFFGLLCVIGAQKYDLPILSFVILLGVFAVDATATLLRRLIQGEKIWQAHRSHYYQRVANLGLAHHKIAIAMLVLMIFCSVLATLTIRYHDIVWLGMLAAGLILLLAIVVVTKLEKK